MFTVSSLGRDKYDPNNTSPWIRPAGVSTAVQESAKDALTWQERPQTPPEQKKYRQSTVHEPGIIVRHYGAAEDPLPEGPFGDKTKSQPGESVSDYLKGYPNTEIGRWALERSEDVYASSKKEPLGKGFVRGYKIPDGLGTERPFGVVIDAKAKDRGNQAGTIIFPTDLPPEEENEATHTMYVRSHAAYAPGEQRRRNYDWDKTGVNPEDHRFGAVDKDDYREGVRKALQPGLDQTAPQPAKVASKLHEDFKLSATDYLGKTRKLGTGERPQLPPDHAFGMPSLRRGPEPGVEKLLHGAYTPEQQQPDADLGKSLREGWRNIAPEGRTFGVPSIRTDIPLPKATSVSNTINYGNEPDALQLLRPPRSVERGIHEEHYMQLRPKDDVRELVKEADIEMDDATFDRVFEMAAQADGESQQCCLDTFFRARHHDLSRTIQVAVPF
uniref:EFHB C-terminal EF-hand domain-containing protein n=1 Tax=Chlamydomonas chlamydogama TaxID=225041 RepID=A0A7S2VV15_9CHLO|mmetsp:Transcript_1355/g.2951  ORF Transcript_1355/g.2951 Transcript_1355/m.2951 type:complete len:442 (+) Transcript_1355:120-1445(+)